MAERVERGNRGEHHVAALLDTLDGAGWTILNDRYKSPTSPANLDHVVVGPPGVFVIDAKNWTGGRLRLDERGMAYAGYRRDDQLCAVVAAAGCVDQEVRRVVAAADTTPVLALVGDVGLVEPVARHGVVLLPADRLLHWLTSHPRRLTRQQVHQLGSALDAALPPRTGSPYACGPPYAGHRRTGGHVSVTDRAGDSPTRRPQQRARRAERARPARGRSGPAPARRTVPSRRTTPGLPVLAVKLLLLLLVLRFGLPTAARLLTALVAVH